MKTYLNALRNALKKTDLTAVEIEDVLADHRDMIETAVKEGLREEDIEKRFGAPETVAEELSAGKKQEKKDETPPWKSFDVGDDFKEVDIRLTGEAIKVKTVPGDRIEIRIDDEHDADGYDASYDDGVLTLRTPKVSSGLLSFLFSHKLASFTLALPKRVKLQSYSHKGVSGEALIKDLRTEHLMLSTTSGDTKLKDVEADDATFNSVSGDFDIRNLHANTLKVSLVSGDMTLEGVPALKRLDIHSVSGDAHIEDVVCESCHLGTVSGDIDGVEFYPEKVSLRSISGDIRIENKEKRDIEIVKKKTVSGNIVLKTVE